MLAAWWRLSGRLSSWCGIFTSIEWSDSPWLSEFISQMELGSGVEMQSRKNAEEHAEVLTKQLWEVVISEEGLKLRRVITAEIPTDSCWIRWFKIMMEVSVTYHLYRMSFCSHPFYVPYKVLDGIKDCWSRTLFPLGTFVISNVSFLFRISLLL